MQCGAGTDAHCTHAGLVSMHQGSQVPEGQLMPTAQNCSSPSFKIRQALTGA